MQKTMKDQLISALEELYGEYRHNSALFGNANFSKIASDLCYSNSHFTKLISGSASNPMYERALKNISGLQKIKNLEKEIGDIKSSHNNKSFPKKYLLFSLLGLILCCVAFLLLNKKSNTVETSIRNAHPLDVYFETNNSNYYKSPYLSEEQVHEYCPGSAFEGKWELNENYIIPIPYKVPGLYYVGKSADIRLKCRKSNLQEDRGKELIGFENIHNEIWFDTSLTPVDTKYFSKTKRAYTPEFSKIDFNNQENFTKIADVYSCFFDEIIISKDSIYRKGEPCGRYANAVNEQIHKEFNLDLNHIIEYIIGNMNFALCKPVENKYCNPNDLKNNESILAFDCSCSIKTENLGLGGSYPYTKSIKLMEQNYQSNLLCNCEE